MTKVSTIFKDKPEKWGLRGDPFFWDYLEKVFSNFNFPFQYEEFERTIKDEHYKLTDNELTEESISVCEEFKYGGMSSGGISGKFWCNYALPLLKKRLDKKNNNFLIKIMKIIFNKYDYQCFDFIPFKKIGPFLLDKQIDDKEFVPSGVKFLYERTLNCVTNEPIWIDSPEHIRRGYLTKVYINYNGVKINITCYAKKFIKNLEKITDDVIVNVENDYMNIYSPKLGISAGAINFDGDYYIQVLNFYGEKKFEQFLNKI